MKTYCQPVFVAPFGHVTSIYVVGFHVDFTFALFPLLPPKTNQVAQFVLEITVTASIRFFTGTNCKSNRYLQGCTEHA